MGLVSAAEEAGVEEVALGHGTLGIVEDIAYCVTSLVHDGSAF